jgi:signal transduction histidine kinase/DNA-binding response OmpR family regulator
MKRALLKMEEPAFDDYTEEKVNILVVDDLPEKLLAYEAILEELDQNLVTAVSGEDALKAVLRQEFAVILLDVNMPGMDGFETAALIRQRRKSAHTPIIFLTAFTDEIRMAQGYASGAVDYLPTPVIPEVLKAKVKVFIELSQMRRQAAMQAEERAKRTAAEESARRSQFLVRVGEILSTSPSSKEIIRHMTQLPIPEIADFAALRITHPDTNQVFVKLCKHEHGRLQVQSLSEDHRFCRWTKIVAAQVAASKNHVTLTHLAEPELADMQEALALPIMMQGHPNGLLILARKNQHYLEDEITLAHDFANRASVAIENVLLVERIREADHRKDEFLAMLAHELRNPLAPIRNALHIMKRSPTLDMQKEAHETIENQIQHMIHLVDDLMDVSRITQGKIELRRETISLHDALHHAIETARPLIDQRNHKLRVEINAAPLWVHADATRISQIFSNLLNNASKYTNDGGEIIFSCEEVDGQARIIVQDNGIGIPSTMLNRIFDLFAQVDSSLERAQGGLGIGLTLVKNLTEMHNGHIVAESEGINKGSRFLVHLPLTQTATKQPEAYKADALLPHAEQPLRVLVVDDNEASAKTMGWMIELAGHETQLVNNGIQALEVAQTFQPSVVLLDIGLPGMNGYDVCRQMRQQPQLKDTMFIAQTGWGQEEHRRRSKEAGFHHHLVKPIDLAMLQELLDLRYHTAK